MTLCAPAPCGGMTANMYAYASGFVLGLLRLMHASQRVYYVFCLRPYVFHGVCIFLPIARQSSAGVRD